MVSFNKDFFFVLPEKGGALSLLLDKTLSESSD